MLSSKSPSPQIYTDWKARGQDLPLFKSTVIASNKNKYCSTPSIVSELYISDPEKVMKGFIMIASCATWAAHSPKK